MNNLIKNIGWGMLAFILVAGGLQSCSDFEKELKTIDLPRLLTPQNLAFGVITATTVELSWSGSAPAFEVELSPTQDFTSGVSVKTVTQSPSVIEVDDGTTCYFRIRGVSGQERPAPSYYSNVISTTLPINNPLPNVKAVSKVSYTTNPLVITTTVTVTWGIDGVDPEDITSLTFTAGNNEPVVYPVSPQEAAAQQKVVTTGLDVSTSYVIRFYNGNKLRNLYSVTTQGAPVIPSDNMTMVSSSDNLRNVILSESRKDTLFLQPGTYSITSNTLLTRNLVIVSDKPEATTINMSRSFNLSGSFNRVVFKNITLNCETYFIQATVNETQQFALDEYRIDNCIIDLNSINDAARATILTVTARVAGFTANIKECVFENVTAYSNAANAQATFIQVSASDVYMSIDKIKMKNCTSANTGRGIMILGQINEPVNLNIENCTFYDVSKTNNIVINIAKTNTATVNISKSIFHFGSTGYTLASYVEGGAQIKVSDTYYFKGQTPIFNKTAGMVGLIEYNGTPDDLFVSPNDNLAAPGVSFRLKDSSLSGIGDLKWQ
ncbi:MAG: DUF5123 domain-containing protein [Candidatus Symbiothrix sp.]|jgi:hypothetical protein|nr:DUF5123 domain-containing protein [Candidatus Symbiothrix sp.]